MKILNTRQFNEKLNIQPIPMNRFKGGFYSLYKTKEVMRANFKTGDIAIISEGQLIGNKYDEYNAKLQVYISYEDWMKDEKYYMGETGICFLNKDYVGEGVFVSVFGDKYNNYEYLKSFDRNFEIKNKDNIHRIYAVYRVPSIVKTPIDFEYIGNKFNDKVNIFSLLWARGANLNEKLNIQPISKKRLDGFYMPTRYKSAGDMRANFKTGDLALIGKPNYKHIGVFISKEDIENETYDGYYYCGFKYRESDSIFTFWMDCEPWGDGEYRKACSLVGNKMDNSVIKSWITTSVHALPVRLVKD